MGLPVASRHPGAVRAVLCGSCCGNVAVWLFLGEETVAGLPGRCNSPLLRNGCRAVAFWRRCGGRNEYPQFANRPFILDNIISGERCRDKACLVSTRRIGQIHISRGTGDKACLVSTRRIGQVHFSRGTGDKACLVSTAKRHGEIHLCAFVVYVFYSVDCAVGMCGYSCEAAEAAVS